MKRMLSFWLALVLIGCVPVVPSGYGLKEGDLLFQSLPHSPLVDTIEGASHSPYSHCGILAKKDSRWVVIEAIGPVRETPLAAWIRQGREHRFHAYRIEASLTPKIPAIIAAARTYLGRPYDIHYSFDDARIYCSELIYKSVKTATGQALGKPARLGDLNWQPYAAFIHSIEGQIPLDRELITPQALADAKELTEVYATP